MEITYEQARAMIQKSLDDHPEMGAIMKSTDFRTTLEWILTHEGVGLDKLELVEDQILLVLAFYAPLSSLGEKIAESLDVSIETGEAIATLVESTLFDSVIRQLTTFDFEWSEEMLVPQAESALKEKLELRPEGVPVVEQMTQPLTREELLNALSAKRTMASDMARVQGTPAVGAPTVGYQNYKPPTESTPGQ